MPDRKQPNDEQPQQRRNAVGQIQEQLDRQAAAIASIQADEDFANSSVQEEEIK